MTPDREHLELHVDDDRVPRHPYRLVPGSKRRFGCLPPLLVVAAMLAVLLLAAPRAAHVIPAVSFEETSGNRGQLPVPSDLDTVPIGTMEVVALSPDVAGRRQPETTKPSPAPSADIGTALFSASATWCAPNPRTGQCLRWGGDALLAALPSYAGTPYTVRVWFGERHVDVEVVSICGCGVDLSPFAFKRLAALSRGRIPVTVEGPVQ